MDAIRVEVAADQAGARLDRFLAEGLGLSRARVRHLLEVGRVELAGRRLGLADKSHQTAAGEIFEIEGPLQVSEERPMPRADLPLEIVAEGPGWLVVDKPAGMGVHPLHPGQQDTVLNAVIARHPEMLGVGEAGLRSGVVHRLDVDTTGALAFATDESHWKRLRGAFSEHRVKKSYLALVASRFETRQRVEVSLAVTRHRPAHVEVVESGGRICRQRVTPLEVYAAATLVEVDLETGFLHQIRATLAHLGHPILGDLEYGGPAALGSLSFARPMLHSARLWVDEIAVKIEPPSDFAAAAAALAADTDG